MSQQGPDSLVRETNDALAVHHDQRVRRIPQQLARDFISFGHAFIVTRRRIAAPRERYDDYVAAVRREYAHLDDEVFHAGRAEVLRGLAAKPHLFHTAYAREHWEAAARANLERELGALAGGTGDSPGTR